MSKKITIAMIGDAVSIEVEGGVTLSGNVDISAQNAAQRPDFDEIAPVGPTIQQLQDAGYLPPARHPLQTIFDQCVEQAASGKGEERHGHGADFMEQPWLSLAHTHGVGFFTGQAAKKVEEAAGFLKYTGADSVEQIGRWRNELKGAINYLAMGLLFADVLESESKPGCAGCGDCSCGESPQPSSHAVPMQFNPVTGWRYLSNGFSPDQFRADQGNVAWLFNPWTGDRRDASDIGTDPFGHLIAPF